MPKEGGLILADNLGSFISCSRACDKATYIGSDPWLKQSPYGWDIREKIEGPRSHCPSKVCPRCPKRLHLASPSSYGILKCVGWHMLIINNRFQYSTFIYTPLLIIFAPIFLFCSPHTPIEPLSP